MTSKAISAFAALAAAAVLAHAPAHARQAANAPIDPRPADPTANLPSDTGAQTTLPSGAVTGAGQPQGTLPQHDDGAPGGAESRARERRSSPASDGDDDASRASRKPSGSAHGTRARSRAGDASD